MTRTRLCLITASILIVAAVALGACRWWVLGSDIDGPLGDSAWSVTVVVAGEVDAKSAKMPALYVPLPLDFRHQHILVDERYKLAKSADPTRHEVVFHPEKSVSGKFRFTCSYRCLMAMRRQTTAMHDLTEKVDAKPEGPVLAGYLKLPARRAESDAILDKGKELTLAAPTEMDQVTALFRFVDGLPTEPSLDASSMVTAYDCLKAGSGDSAGKSRLLVALCRSRGIPARLASGLVLVGDQEQNLHHWAEAWVAGRWLPLCPTYHHFDAREFPKNYLVLFFGDGSPIHGVAVKNLRFGFSVQALHDPLSLYNGQRHSTAKSAWLKASLFSLQPAEQRLVKFLLLMPLAALIVTFFRIVIGVPTFGTFGPALLGLALLDLVVLPWGLLLFVLLVLVGWVMRRLLDRYHLLMVPRTAALLTMIIFMLIVVVAVASHLGIPITRYVALFPLIILTHLVERFWTVEAEDGTAASFKSLLGTMVVSATVSLALIPDVTSAWLFRFPEGLGLLLAAQLLLGRYTGYRLSELYRFRDLVGFGTPPPVTPPPQPMIEESKILVQEELLREKPDVVAVQLPPAETNGHPGNEPAQCPVHSGPEPAPVVSTGGREAKDA